MEKIAEYLAYGIVIIIIFFKSFFSIYKYVKDLFKNKENVTIQNKFYTPCKSQQCISLSEMLSLLLEQEKLLKILLTIDSTIFKQQLDNFEKNINSIRFTIENDLFMLIYNTHSLSSEQKKLYHNYIEVLLQIVVNIIHNHFKFFCKKNNFDLYSTSEFNNEIEKYINIIITDITNLILMHKDNFNFIKLDEELQKYKDKLTDLLYNSFLYAREVSIKEHNKINELKENFEKKVSTILQRDYCLLF